MSLDLALEKVLQAESYGPEYTLIARCHLQQSSRAQITISKLVCLTEQVN